MKKIITALLAFCCLLAVFACGRRIVDDSPAIDGKQMDSIYVYRGGESFSSVKEIKVDLKNKQLLEHITERGNDSTYRDPLAENEGYSLVTDFDGGKIAAFLQAAERYGFADWEESYIEYAVADGDVWRIEINFSDGTTKSISGNSAYPETWEEMSVALEELTGKRFL